ncbi:hypothetical protein ACWIE6_00550 [Paenibacillus taichungensis]
MKMSPSVVEAYVILMEMLTQATKQGSSCYRIDRIEQAMDYLLNKPDKVGDPQIMVRNLMGGAGTKLRSRIKATEKIARMAEDSMPGIFLQGAVTHEFEYLRIEFEDIVSRSDLREKMKFVLRHLSSESGANELAEKSNISLGTARKNISNARKCFKSDY